jgi:hypothetical protein
MNTLFRPFLPLLAFLLSSGAAAPAQSISWLPLFDGKTLNGWTQKGGQAKFRVEEGQIIGSTVPNTPNSFLCTTRQFTNFILDLDFKVDDGLNSGVQIRSHCFDKPTAVNVSGKEIKIAAGRVHGYQVEIDPSDRAWTGGLYDEGRRGYFINDLKNNEPARKAFKHNDWNHFRIECQGDSFKTWLNGVPATDCKDDMTPSGFLGLQVHSVGKRTEPLQVRFRNIRLKEL